MAEMGLGYGSEWHLLRYLGRHRDELDAKLLAETGGDEIQWLDFKFTRDQTKYFDRELKGMEFILPDTGSRILSQSRLRDEWRRFWPQGGESQNWDAVGVVRRSSHYEWLLVEAKAHIGELPGKPTGACQASKDTIKAAFSLVGESIGVRDTSGWADSCYYQYANRLATLWFLLTYGIPARLVYIYFLCDTHANCICPGDEAGWRPSIDAQRSELKLDKAANWQTIGSNVHEVFLDVQGR